METGTTAEGSRLSIFQSKPIEEVVDELDRVDSGDIVLSPEEHKALFARQKEFVDYSYEQHSFLLSESKRINAKADLFYEAGKALKNAGERYKARLKSLQLKRGIEELFGNDMRTLVYQSTSYKEFEPPTAELALKFPKCVNKKTRWISNTPSEQAIKALQVLDLDSQFIVTEYTWNTVEAKKVAEKNPAAFEGKFGAEITHNFKWDVNKNVKRKGSSRSASKNSINPPETIGIADTSGSAPDGTNNGATDTDCADGNTAQPVASEM